VIFKFSHAGPIIPSVVMKLGEEPLASSPMWFSTEVIAKQIKAS